MFFDRPNFSPAADVPFLPDPERAKTRNRHIVVQLAASVMELLRACRGVVHVDEAALDCRIAALGDGRRIRPGVFLLYYDCLEAARRDDPDTLAARLHAMATISLEAPAFAVRNLDDASLPATEWSRYRHALAASPDASISMISASPELFASARQLLEAATGAILAADPALAGEISALIGEIVFAENSPVSNKDFGGATSFKAWGALFLNARRHRSVVSMVNGLVHESAHALLFALSSGEPMVENDPNERYQSPLRADRRPMEGTFHATFVSARMCYGMDRLLASASLDRTQREEAAGARDAACAAFEAGYATVCEHARPTRIGQQVMDGAARFMRGRTRYASCAGG